MYARVENGIVMELIPAVDPAFPEIPIEQRFHESIIAQLVVIPEDVSVEQNWTYDAETGVFAAPVEPEPIQEEQPVTENLEGGEETAVLTEEGKADGSGT